MKIIPKSNIELPKFPLPIYHSIHIADAINKEGDEFSIFIGLEKKYVEQLKQLSLDEGDIELQNNTGDRARFGQGEGQRSYEEWYGKNRTPFALIHKRTDTLSALVWFGPRPLLSNEDNWHTLGWRSYKPFRGKGIMKVFTQFSIDFYKTKFPDIKLWISAEKDNVSSIRLAENLGFTIYTEASDSHSIVMVI